GDSEAGLIRDRVHWRSDTPIHSILHEACHAICMDSGRRLALDRDAGGDFAEENAVCYLQILLADELPGVGRERMWRDMDAWGYTFPLGSARAWFEQDASDAREWLVVHGLVDQSGATTWNPRACRRLSRALAELAKAGSDESFAEAERSDGRKILSCLFPASLYCPFFTLARSACCARVLLAPFTHGPEPAP